MIPNHLSLHKNQELGVYPANNKDSQDFFHLRQADKRGTQA